MWWYFICGIVVTLGAWFLYRKIEKQPSVLGFFAIGAVLIFIGTAMAFLAVDYGMARYNQEQKHAATQRREDWRNSPDLTLTLRYWVETNRDQFLCRNQYLVSVAATKVVGGEGDYAARIIYEDAAKKRFIMYVEFWFNDPGKAEPAMVRDYRINPAQEMKAR